MPDVSELQKRVRKQRSNIFYLYDENQFFPARKEHSCGKPKIYLPENDMNLLWMNENFI